MQKEELGTINSKYSTTQNKLLAEIGTKVNFKQKIFEQNKKSKHKLLKDDVISNMNNEIESLKLNINSMQTFEEKYKNESELFQKFKGLLIHFLLRGFL